MIEPIPSRVAVLETRVAEIKEDTSEMKAILKDIKSYVDAEKGKTSTTRYIGHVVSVFFGGIAGVISSHIKFG